MPSIQVVESAYQSVMQLDIDEDGSTLRGSYHNHHLTGHLVPPSKMLKAAGSISVASSSSSSTSSVANPFVDAGCDPECDDENCRVLRGTWGPDCDHEHRYSPQPDPDDASTSSYQSSDDGSVSTSSSAPSVANLPVSRLDNAIDGSLDLEAELGQAGLTSLIHKDRPAVGGSWEIVLDLQTLKGTGWWSEEERSGVSGVTAAAAAAEEAANLDSSALSGVKQAYGVPYSPEEGIPRRKKYKWEWNPKDQAQQQQQKQAQQKQAQQKQAQQHLVKAGPERDPCSRRLVAWLRFWVSDLSARANLVMTTASLVMAAAGVDEGLEIVLPNLAFNLVYALSGLSFLVIWACCPSLRPRNAMEPVGTLTFTMGYGSSVGIFADLAASILESRSTGSIGDNSSSSGGGGGDGGDGSSSSSSSSDGTPAQHRVWRDMYAASSLFFCLGSIAFIIAYKKEEKEEQEEEEEQEVEGEWAEAFGEEFGGPEEGQTRTSEPWCSCVSCTAQSRSLWGSAAFLLGAVIFLCDSSWWVLSTKHHVQESWMMVVAGYSVFAVGRVLFVANPLRSLELAANSAHCLIQRSSSLCRVVSLPGGGWHLRHPRHPRQLSQYTEVEAV